MQIDFYCFSYMTFKPKAKQILDKPLNIEKKSLKLMKFESML